MMSWEFSFKRPRERSMATKTADGRAGPGQPPANSPVRKWTVIIIGRFEADKLLRIGFRYDGTISFDSPAASW